MPLTFTDPRDYDKVEEMDKMSILGLAGLSPGKDVEVKLHHTDGTTETLKVRHSMNEEQIAWFRAGSALNVLKKDS